VKWRGGEFVEMWDREGGGVSGVLLREEGDSRVEGIWEGRGDVGVFIVVVIRISSPAD
jgi:hypothetical protein